MHCVNTDVRMNWKIVVRLHSETTIGHSGIGRNLYFTEACIVMFVIESNIHHTKGNSFMKIFNMFTFQL